MPKTNTRFKLSDQAFIDKAYDSVIPKKSAALNGDDLSKIRGMMTKTGRVAQEFSPDVDGGYEVVSFVHPQSNRRVYGMLVAVTHEGDAKVEIGDGEYAVVPPDEIRRLGEKEDRDEIRKKLKAAIGQFDTKTIGIRADFHETQTLSPLSASDDSLHLMTLGYSVDSGLPTDAEAQMYVKANYPGAQIVDADISMPGRLGLALQFDYREAEALKQAEMSGVKGGEVTETLDPEDVKDEDHEDHDSVVDHDADVHKTAAAPVDPKATAEALLRSGKTNIVATIVRTYFTNGGDAAVARSNGTFNTQTVLEAAIKSGLIQRVNRALWKQIQAIVGSDALAPTSPKVEDTSKRPGQPDQVPQTSIPGSPPQEQPENPEYEGEDPFKGQVTDQFSSPVRNVGPRQDNDPDHVGPKSGSVSAFSRSAKKQKPTETGGAGWGFKHLTDHNLPANMTELYNSMKMDGFARRGIYTFAKVYWDPKMLKGQSDWAVKNHVISFVKAKCGSSAQSRDFGIIGKVYVKVLDVDKGQAEVQFASEHQGPATTVVTNE